MKVKIVTRDVPTQWCVHLPENDQHLAGLIYLGNQQWKFGNDDSELNFEASDISGATVWVEQYYDTHPPKVESREDFVNFVVNTEARSVQLSNKDFSIYVDSVLENLWRFAHQIGFEAEFSFFLTQHLAQAVCATVDRKRTLESMVALLKHEVGRLSESIEGGKDAVADVLQELDRRLRGGSQ